MPLGTRQTRKTRQMLWELCSGFPLALEHLSGWTAPEGFYLREVQKGHLQHTLGQGSALGHTGTGGPVRSRTQESLADA